ncbi:hypothetical protein EMCG_03733 [[Emmonsia] crescens]|uniref:Uncharacterized protein n=1 Tax=[Emmonsia] crescens TaxID=73230 RepID=A0A0G2IZS1_9EURO|nr:hypothetical protein EMCG_03733 [Emmonsia crescens UAMH 3008]
MGFYLLVGVFTLFTGIGFYHPVPLTNIHPERHISERLVGALQLTATGECAARLYNYFTTPYHNDEDSYVFETDPKAHETYTTTHIPILEQFQQDNVQRTHQDFQIPLQTVTVFVASVVTDQHGASQTIMADNIYEVPTNPEWVLSRWSLLLEGEILRSPNMYTTIILLFAFGVWLLSYSRRHAKISESHDTTLLPSKGTDTEFLETLTRLFELISRQNNTKNTTTTEAFNSSLQHLQEQENQLQTEQGSKISCAHFSSLGDLVDDLKNKMALPPDLEALSAKVEASDSGLQSLKKHIDHLLKAPRLKPTGAELTPLSTQVPDLKLKYTSKSDLDQLSTKSTEIMDVLNLQDTKFQQAVDRWNEFTTWLQELQVDIQDLRVAFETKGKEVKDLTIGFAQPKEKQTENPRGSQQTLIDTNATILEVKKKITSSDTRMGELAQEVNTLKEHTKNSKKTEISTIVLADQIGELQAKMASSEMTTQKLVRDWEMWMQVDDVSEGDGSTQAPNLQIVDLRAKVEWCENAVTTMTGNLDTLKNSNSNICQTGELQRKLKSHEATVQRLADDLAVLKNVKQDPNNEVKQIQEKVNLCDTAIERLTKNLENLKIAQQSSSQPEMGADVKMERLRSTLNQVDTIALATRSDVERNTIQIKKVELSTQTCHSLLAQLGIEIFKLREKLDITTPLTNLLDIENELAQTDAAKTAASTLPPISSRRESAKVIRNESSQTSTVPKDGKPRPSTTISAAKSKENTSRGDATSTSEEAVGKESKKPTIRAAISAPLASAPLDPAASTPGKQPKKKCVKRPPEANPPLKGDKTKESSDLLGNQTTSSSKPPSYPSSSTPSSRQPDKSISRWDPAYVGPERPFSRDKKGNKNKTSRK